MTIEIHKPELEALILERMKKGAFRNIEDALLQALKSSHLPTEQDAQPPNGPPALTGADLVAVMQSSPSKEICLEPTRERLPVRDVEF